MLQYALKELTRRKSRSLLSIFGIAVCATLLTAVLCVSQAVRNAAQQPFDSANADLVVQRELAECPFDYVKHAGKLGSIPIEALQRVRALADVEYATGVLQLWTVSGTTDKERTVVTGIEPEYQKRLGPVMRGDKCCNLTDHKQGGRYLNVSSHRECIIDQAYADKHHLQLGDTVILAAKKFKIVGTLESSTSARIAAGEIYVTLKDAQDLLPEGTEVLNGIFVRVKNSKALRSVERQIRDLVPVDTQQGDKLVLTTDSNIMSNVAGIAIIAQSATRWVSGLVVLVVFLLVLKSSLASVNERMREIGTMKAVGWLDRHVAKLMAIENAIVGLIGSLTGTLVGWGAAYAYTSSARLRLPQLLNDYPACASISPPVEINFTLTGCEPMLLGALSTALGIGVIAGCIAARRAAQLPPAEALRRV